MTRRALLVAIVALLAVGGLVAMPAAAVATSAPTDGSEIADLAIDVPEFVDGDVAVTHEENRTIYDLPHGTAEIKPINFDAEDVESYGIEEGEGEITFDDQFGTYRFDSGGLEGSFTAYWVVEETETIEHQDGNETVLEEETTQTRYTAVIRVSEHEDRELVPAGEYQDQQEAADNWEWFEGELEEIFGEDIDPTARAEQLLSWAETYAHPIASLFGQPGSMLFMLFMTREGRLILLLFGALHLFSRRADIRYLLKRESTKPDAHDAKEDLAELEKEERKRALQNHDWQDVAGHDDRTARSYREWMGENPHVGGRRMLELFLPNTLLKNRLIAMGHNGWVGVVERGDDPVATDGGAAAADAAGDAPAPVMDVWVERKADVDEDLETVDLADPEPPEWFVEELPVDDPDVLRFDYVTAEIPPGEGVAFDELDDEELHRRLRVQTSDFETDEEWMELLLEFISHVRYHDYTDQDGVPNHTHVVLNEWLRTSQLFADRYDWPAFEFLKDALEHALADQDTVEDAEELLDRVEANVDLEEEVV